MYCGKCGNKLNVGDSFCTSCGNKVIDNGNIQEDAMMVVDENKVQNNNMTTVNKNDVGNNNVINTNENRFQESSKKNEENVSGNKLISYFATNFRTKYEKILLVGGAVVSSIFIYYLFKGFGLIAGAFVADILFMVFIVAFGGEPFVLTEKAIIDFENTFPIFVVVFIIFALFYGIIYSLLYKEYRNNMDLNNRGIKVNKTKYMLTLFFLGIFGVHRFIINDKFGGKIRLMLFLSSAFSICLYSVFGEFSFILFILLLGCDIGLVIADMIIANIKMPDNEKNIYV